MTLPVFITPYSLDRKLFEAYDNAIRNQPPGQWVCMLDGDTAFLRSDFGHTIAAYIDKYPDTGIFTCYASRCFYNYQVPAYVNQQNDSIKYHKQIAENLHKTTYLQVTELNKQIAGHMIVIKKETWDIIRLNVLNRCKHETIEGVDTAISREILESGRKIYLMNAVYLLHYYRLIEGQSSRKHLGYGMKLHIITPCSRPENLAEVATSINIPSASYTWHIVFDRPKENVPASLIPPKAIAYYHTNPQSKAGNAQRNFILDKLSDGYIYFLDDDTTMHPNLYQKVSTLHNDFIHFDQVFPDGKKRIGGTVKVNHIDTGSVVVDRKIIGNIRFKIERYDADGYLWEQVFRNAQTPVYIPEPLSIYNNIPKKDKPTPQKQKKMNELFEFKKTELEDNTDVVYVLGTGSRWNNNEIRFSIRSLYQHLSGFRNIYIIGEDPGFLKGDNLFIINFPDKYNPSHNADGNIIEKVMHACTSINDLSDNFIFINDDNYILQHMYVSEIYPFHKGNMDTLPDETFERGMWGMRLFRTKQHLQANGIVPLHFDHHSPILFNKHKFVETLSQYNYQTVPGLTIKSLYGSHHYPDAPVMNGEEVAIFRPNKLNEIRHQLRFATYTACDDNGLNSSFKFWLATTFPEASPLETNPPNDVMISLAQWSADGNDYDQAVEIYKQFFPLKSNLNHLIRHNKTQQLHAKINFYLKEKLSEL